MSRVWLMLTDRCNLDCPFCYQKNKGQNDMDFELLEKSLFFILDNSEEDVEIMLWGGEPLLRFDLIKEILSKYPHLNWRIATNGFLLNPDIVDFFFAFRDSLGICLSVATGSDIPYFYNLNKFPRLFVHIIATDVSKIFELVDRLNSLGFYKFQISLAHLWNYSDEDFLIYEKELEKVKRYCSLGRICVLNWDDMMYLENINSPKKINFCGAGCSAMSISPLGDIYPCDWFYSLGVYKMGDVFNGIDNEVRSLFMDINKNRDAYFSECMNCTVKDKCGSHVCLAENYVVNGSIYLPVYSTCKAFLTERKVVIGE